MVLINNLTVDEINAALLHLQRSQNEVVGGEKGTTIQNITITNTGGGSGNSGGTVSQDWAPIIDALESRINAAEKATLELDKKAAENEQIDSAQTEQISSILEQLMSLSSNGITSLQFDATNRYLIIYTEDGNTYDVQITSEPITMTFDSTTNKLTLVMGSQTKEVTLPYINASQKGVAGGVATLDENGRVPYSQLPESAMEFKGEWNASTNTPTLADGVGTNGDFYVCNVGGTVNFGTQAEPREVTFVPNDRVIYNGDTDLWVKLPAGQVISVNGQSGVVELDAADIPYNSTLSVKDMIDGLEPVDNVTLGEMSAVTSNAVAQAIAGGGGTDIAVYPTLADAEADLANLNVGDFIATEQGGDGVTDAVTDGDLRAVTSNAVAQSLTGYQTELKRYSKNLTLNNSDVATYGYKSMSIPSDISNANVIAVNVYTSAISANNGFQITPIYCGAGTFYVTYYKPTSWAQTSITFTFTITYLS
jgi:hypothetical protein